MKRFSHGVEPTALELQLGWDCACVQRKRSNARRTPTVHAVRGDRQWCTSDQQSRSNQRREGRRTHFSHTSSSIRGDICVLMTAALERESSSHLTPRCDSSSGAHTLRTGQARRTRTNHPQHCASQQRYGAATANTQLHAHALHPITVGSSPSPGNLAASRKWKYAARKALTPRGHASRWFGRAAREDLPGRTLTLLFSSSAQSLFDTPIPIPPHPTRRSCCIE